MQPIGITFVSTTHIKQKWNVKLVELR